MNAWCSIPLPLPRGVKLVAMPSQLKLLSLSGPRKRTKKWLSTGSVRPSLNQGLKGTVVVGDEFNEANYSLDVVVLMNSFQLAYDAIIMEHHHTSDHIHLDLTVERLTTLSNAYTGCTALMAKHT
jgi:hypothetical protein